MSGGSSEAPWHFENRQRKVAFNERRIRVFLEALSRDLSGGLEFSVVIGSEAAVRQANRRFRGVSRATDVLSFPDGQDGYLGDVLISAPRAARQAAEYGHSVETEIQTLALHGLLHLNGHDHAIDNGEMRDAEERLRRFYGLPPGLIERGSD